MARGDTPLSGISVLKRATRGDYSAFARACVNTLGATLFLAGASVAVEHGQLSACLFCGGNVCYIITGVWWAIATHSEFKARYPLAISEELETSSLNICTPSGGARPILVAGPGSVAPPFVTLPPGLKSSDIIQAFHALCWLDIFSALCQVFGAIIFNIGCITQQNPKLTLWSISLWSTGSALFLLQGIIGHIMCTSFIGTWLTLLPRTSHYKRWLNSNISNQYPLCCQPREYNPSAQSSTYAHLKHACVHKCIPAALLNTVGSALFLIGSLILIYEFTEASNICFGIGSALFAISNYSDGANIIDELYKRISLEEKIN